MATVHLRKDRAGSDSWGHVWSEDGAVVDVDYEQALLLLAIPDGGFSVVDHQESEEGPGAEEDPGLDADGAATEEPDVSEVAPEPEPDASPDTKPAPRRGGRPRKTVEEG